MWQKETEREREREKIHRKDIDTTRHRGAQSIFLTLAYPLFLCLPMCNSERKRERERDGHGLSLSLARCSFIPLSTPLSLFDKKVSSEGRMQSVALSLSLFRREIKREIEIVKFRERDKGERYPSLSLSFSLFLSLSLSICRSNLRS